MSEAAVPPPAEPSERAPAPPVERPSLWRLFVELWRDYPVVTRTATVLLVLASLLNIAVNASGEGYSRLGPLRWLPADWQSALASDGTITLLTLAVALGVGLHIKRRQLEGLLDGTDHYDIGRALAYGYFCNFLVAALLLVRLESRKREGPPLKFHMIFPRNVDDLERFKTRVEPAIRQVSGKRELEGVYRSGGSVIKRSILIVSRTRPEGEGPGDEVFFDFPTTLYTLHDYYETWNTWLAENGRTPMSGVAVEMMQERQVAAFKRHLHDLFHSEVGLKGVRDLGISQQEELVLLLEDHFLDVTPDEMQERLHSAAG